MKFQYQMIRGAILINLYVKHGPRIGRYGRRVTTTANFVWPRLGALLRRMLSLNPCYCSVPSAADRNRKVSVSTF